jgi:hypothetical protein
MSAICLPYNPFVMSVPAFFVRHLADIFQPIFLPKIAETLTGLGFARAEGTCVWCMAC